MSDQESRSSGWEVDDDAAELYEEYFVPIIFAPWGERLVDQGDLQAGEQVLDVGTGTGIVARLAAAHVGDSGAVVGVDIDEGMLGVAEELTADLGPTIEWRQEDAADLPFSDERFDAVFCQQALQLIDDPVAALREMRRVLSPDGIVVISVWRSLEYSPGYVVLADALDRHLEEGAGEMMRSPFDTWGTAELRTLVREAEFDEVTITIGIGSERFPSIEEFVRREVVITPLATRFESSDRAIRTDLIQAVKDGLREYADDEGLVFPHELYVVTARR
ncbi:methyltransferase domain-containing protein [Natronococcus sp. A-GB1]|uniref:class I SAM-dependent methyltransferase n=1 Tax=Natronococcus sp. A-GB1 TaxID=3037648 RepID=UPI00241C495B|nr:methyltransferase domain-containing protein [Natronococcus sp. A-GB1]MDG5761210.1 methyltransferase domain-containing protein [Natronococcus sp. A-GB1]